LAHPRMVDDDDVMFRASGKGMTQMSTDSQQNTPAVQRITRRTFLATAAAAMGASVLAACGGGGTGGQPAAGGTSAPAQAGNAIELTQWYHQYGEEGTQQAAMRYAEEYSKVKPNVKINVVWKPGDYGTALNAAMLGSDPPDIFEQSALTPDMVKSGWVTPLDDIFGEAKSDFTAAALGPNTYDGKVYGVKMIFDTGLIYYRKSLLEAAGVTPPTTLDELGAAIDALSQGQVKGIFMGNDGGVGRGSGEVLWSSGHDFLKDGKPDFNNADTVAAYTKYQQFLKDHTPGILNGAPTDWWDPSAFTGGLAAMQWTGLWAMPGIIKAIGDDFGVVPWPAIGAGQGKPATFAGGWSQFVNTKAKNLDEAKAFVKWLWIENKEFQRDWSLSYGFHVPPRSSTAAEAEALKSGPAKEAVDILTAYGVAPSPLWTSAMSTAFNDAVTNILVNGADPKTELDAAQAKVDAELANA
jgi:multiple sugar transport system substrate-binding protein